MIFTDEQISALSGPLDRSAVKQRKQAGTSLSYVEGWHVISEANRIFGFGNWMRETVEIKCVAERERKIGERQREGFGVTYTAKVRVTVGDVVREGVGAGHGIDADLGQAHESAIKEAETDAMKRALITFGNPFGLALYDKDQANVGRPAPVQPVIKTPTIQVPEKDGATDWPGFVKNFSAALVKATDDAWINAFVRTHNAALDNMKAADPTSYANLRKAVTDRRADLSNGQEKAA